MGWRSFELIGHHCRLVQCLQKQEGSSGFIIHYLQAIITHSVMQCTMQNEHPICKHHKQFHSQDEHFDWLKTNSRFNYPMAEISQGHVCTQKSCLQRMVKQSSLIYLIFVDSGVAMLYMGLILQSPSNIVRYDSVHHRLALHHLL